MEQGLYEVPKAPMPGRVEKLLRIALNSVAPVVFMSRLCYENGTSFKNTGRK